VKHQNHESSVRPLGQHTPTIGKGVFIDRSAVVIGDVVIGDESSVWPLTVIRGDMHSIRIGSRTSIQDSTVCHITHASHLHPNGWPLTVGDDCTIAHQVTLHGCTIGNRVLVGMGATVMDGAVVEDNVVIGANSLVPPGKRLESGYLYTGSPARQVRKLTEQEMAYFTYSAGNYCRLKDRYLAEDAGRLCLS